MDMLDRLMNETITEVRCEAAIGRTRWGVRSPGTCRTGVGAQAEPEKPGEAGGASRDAGAPLA